MRYEKGNTAKIIENNSRHHYEQNEVVTILNATPFNYEVTNGQTVQYVYQDDLQSLEISENDAYIITRIEDYVCGQFGEDVGVMKEPKTIGNKDCQELVHYMILQHTDVDTKELSTYYNIKDVTFYSLLVHGDNVDIYNKAVRDLEL
jgi:hypothetical protein|tara:strand:+ start:16 stop:456 length:441 start_codon:yes stop_codon:yes gene_type:complete